MKSICSTLALACVLAGFAPICQAQVSSTSANSTDNPPAGAIPPPATRPRLSPHETISGVIGDRRSGDRVTITYGRPYTKDHKTGQPRVIWGGLVPYGTADRLGADEATLLVTEQPLVIGSTTIPAGAYTLYIVPAEKGASQLAISTRIGKWGIPVDEKHDLARFDLTKESLAVPVDQLTLWVGNDKATGDGVLKILWEKTQFSLHFSAKPSAG